MIELKHLKTLISLRDTGSLTATATSLHLTQSALSHQIKDLEARIGGQLFLRKTRPVRLPPKAKFCCVWRMIFCLRCRAPRMNWQALKKM
ncbi:LysR family transcriptional regulator [Vibrio cholerae]